MRKESGQLAVLVVVASLFAGVMALADGWSPRPNTTLVSADGGVALTLTGNLKVNSGAGADGKFYEDGIDRPSGSATTFNIQNSGAGAMTLQVDGLTVPVLTNGVLSTANGFSGHYEFSSPNFIPLDTAYFAAAGTAYLHYVDMPAGNASADTLCDGLGPSTGTTRPCAWKTMQRALDDIPNGFTVTPIIRLAAGTITGTQIWTMHSIPAASAVVTIQGDTTTPQATFTTTGTGAFSTTSAGSGKTGGVTSFAQMSFTPTVATGSLPATISDADFFFSTVSAIGVLTLRTVLASTGTSMVLNTRSTTAVSTLSPSLYPWATVCSGSVTLVSVVPNGLNLLPVFAISGVKFTGNFNAVKVRVNGVYTTSVASTTDSTMNSGNYFQAPTSGMIGACSNANCAWTDSTISGQVLQINGAWGGILGGVFKGTSTYKLALGAGPGGTIFGAATIKSIAGSDFEGSTTAAIRMMNSVMTPANISNVTSPPTCSSTTDGLTFDIDGSPLFMDYNSVFLVCGEVIGKYGVASKVRTGSAIYMAAPWSPVNVSDATQAWSVGASGVFQASDLPVTDVVEGVVVSDSSQSVSTALTRVAGPLRVGGDFRFGNAATGTVASNAVTCSPNPSNACVITDDGTDIVLATTRTAITWTNSAISSTSNVRCDMCSTPDTDSLIDAVVVPGSGTAQVFLRNVGTGSFTSAGLKMCCTLSN